MPIFKVEVRLNYVTGLPRDCVVNTFHFSNDGTGDVNDVFDRLEDFYTSNHGGAVANELCDFLSPIISTASGASEMFCYLVGTPGPPIAYRTWTLTNTSSVDPLPFEVALCGSYAGTSTGVPSARQRGRIYAGPFGVNALDASTDGFPVPQNGLMASLLASMEFLELGNTPAGAWGVYSRVDDALYPISRGWVDNEFDTQRRRQTEASNRITF
jgi:hypothetical protein